MRALGLVLAVSLGGCFDMPPRPGPGGPPFDAQRAIDAPSAGDAALFDATFGVLDGASAIWQGLVRYVPSLGYLQADAVSSIGRNPTRS